MEFTHIFGNLSLPKLQTLDLINEKGRFKEFDENEIKSIIKAFPNCRDLRMSKSPLTHPNIDMLTENL